MRITLFSPHMDDAVLDAGDHLMLWKTRGWNSTVVSVFTEFGTSEVTNEVRRAVGMNGLSSPQFEKLRKHEDVLAMESLGVHYQHLNFVDAAFRSGSLASVFNGIVPHEDNKIVKKLAGLMGTQKTADKVLVPLGVGGHIDHIIVRRSAEQLFPPDRLGYYVDYPYALKLANWRLNDLSAFLARRISVLRMSKRKWRTCMSYASQIPVLFSRTPHYWECMINI